ncbi:MAG: PilZ domain-containing protein [Alphaproteobacteria bacterium]|nr:PilZ domain-containing protein [Alphaproteobacteria bacterium]
MAADYGFGQGPMERRDAERGSSDQNAHIAFQNSEMDCQLVDISIKGAQIRVANGNEVPNFFELHTPAGEAFLCEVKHRKQDTIGVQFLRHS